MMMRFIIFAISLSVGCWISTTLLAAKLNHELILSNAWFSLGEIIIFPPWLWIKWFLLYGDRFRNLFTATMWPLYLSIFIGMTLSWLCRFLGKRPSSTAHGSSRWLKEEELSGTGLLTNRGVVLGQSLIKKKLLCHDGPEHILAVAPTRGGKGVGLVIPTLLNWQESAVIFDPKGENWQITSGYRGTLGNCFCFDPTSKTTLRFNPLMEIRKGNLEVKDAQNIADIIVDPDGRLETRNHWQNAAHSLLVGAILYVIYNCERQSLAGVVGLLTKSGKGFESTLEEMAQSNHPVVTSVAQEMLNKHVEERSGVLSTAISLLSLFRDPVVAEATDHHDVNIASLRDAERPLSLYLALPPSDISRLRVLLRIMLNQIGRVLTETRVNEGTKNRKILFLLDEFPALGRLEFFESALAYMAGYGLKAFLICQSFNQLQKAYGERNSILDNCHVRIAFANNDDQTARRLSELLGEQTLTKNQTSLSGSRFSAVKQNSSVSNIEFGRPLLLPSEINRLPSDQEIILINGTFPIMAKKIKYYDDKRFTHRLYPAFNVERISAVSVLTSKKPPEEVNVGQAIGSAL